MRDEGEVRVKDDSQVYDLSNLINNRAIYFHKEPDHEINFRHLNDLEMPLRHPSEMSYRQFHIQIQSITQKYDLHQKYKFGIFQCIDNSSDIFSGESVESKEYRPMAEV